MLAFLIVVLVIGLIVGAVARLLMPGPDGIGLFATALVGVGGSFVGAFIGRLLFGPNYGVGFIMSVIGAMIILAIMRSGRRRRVVRYY